MLWAVAIPLPVYAVCLVGLLAWTLRLWIQSAGDAVNLMMFLSIIQCGAACLAMWQTAQNPISGQACMLGLAGMMGNAAYLGLGVVMWTGLRLLAPRHLAVFGGNAMMGAVLLMSALSVLVHTRSALLCKV